MKKQHIKTTLRLDKVPSWEEVLSFWKKAKRLYKQGKIKLRDLVLFGILFTTGARISEILGLKVSDINLKEGIIRIRQLKKRKTTQEVREVILHPDLKPYIYNYIKDKKPDDLLFPMTRQNAFYLIKKFTGYHPHAFRHAVAIKILSETRDLELVRRVLGHTDYSVLKIYLNFTLRDRKTELENALRLSS